MAPPMLSLDVYSYAAVGRLAAGGHDPYSVGPAALGEGSFFAAVDPLWRHTPTPYGPVLVALLTGVAVLGHGSVLATAALVRAVAVVVTAGSVLLAVHVAAPSRRVGVLILTALNPLVLVQLVSGGHVDALVGAAAIGVVALTVEGHPYPAMVAAVAAGLVKAPAFVLVAFVFLYAVRRPGLRRPAAMGLALVATAAGVLGLSWLLLPDAFGWIGALGVPGTAHGRDAPSEWLGWGLHGVSAMVGGGLSTAGTRAAGRVTMLAIGAAAVGLLLWRGTARGDREWALRHVGCALLVCALSAPVFYGWYAAWGLFPLAAAAGRRGRTVLALLSAALLAIALWM
jgi:hypothetical protein